MIPSNVYNFLDINFNFKLSVKLPELTFNVELYDNGTLLIID